MNPQISIHASKHDIHQNDLQGNTSSTSKVALVLHLYPSP